MGAEVSLSATLTQTVTPDLIRGPAFLRRSAEAGPRIKSGVTEYVL